MGEAEFGVLLSDTDEKGAVLAAENLRKTISSLSISLPKGELRVTCSFGIATVPTHTHNGQELYALADRALQVAKKKGRNRVECYVFEENE